MMISVDEPEVSKEWADKKGFSFPLASDPDKRVIGALDLINPDVPDLALHAVFIVDEDGKVFYRKIARRRAHSPEFLDAIDYHYGRGRFASAP